MNALLLAEAAKRTTEGDKAGPIGLAVILVLCIACYFLFKSMSKHMKKVREEFPAEPPTRSGATVAATVVTPTATVVTPTAVAGSDARVDIVKRPAAAKESEPEPDRG